MILLCAQFAVLPKFSVDVSFARPYMLKFDEQLHINLDAKYVWHGATHM